MAGSPQPTPSWLQSSRTIQPGRRLSLRNLMTSSWFPFIHPSLVPKTTTWPFRALIAHLCPGFQGRTPDRSSFDTSGRLPMILSFTDSFSWEEGKKGPRLHLQPLHKQTGGWCCRTKVRKVVAGVKDPSLCLELLRQETLFVYLLCQEGDEERGEGEKRKRGEMKARNLEGSKRWSRKDGFVIFYSFGITYVSPFGQFSCLDQEETNVSCKSPNRNDEKICLPTDRATVFLPHRLSCPAICCNSIECFIHHDSCFQIQICRRWRCHFLHWSHKLQHEVAPTGNPIIPIMIIGEWEASERKRGSWLKR